MTSPAHQPAHPARGDAVGVGSHAWAGIGLAAMAAALTTGVALALRRHARPQPLRPAAPQPVTLRVTQGLNRSAALLGLAALADSAVEHYRGSFHNPAMVTPLVVSSAIIGVSLFGTLDDRPRAHVVRDAAYGAAILTGAVGTGFHLFNVTKRPGGFSWLNLFYGAPLGAPSAIALAGLLGFFAERIRDTPPGEAPDVLGVPGPDALAVLVSAGILGTVADTGLLHFRGAFHDPAMYLPMVVPPVGAALLAGAVLSGGGRFAKGSAKGSVAAARWGLRATAGLGFIGVGFHAFGVHRNMGGWRNWSQNVLNGPPLPAPPSYTALALAGLATLALEEDRRDA